MSTGTPAGPPGPRTGAGAGAGALGVGVAACAACCAGPILGALGAVGIASAAGYLVAGSLALLVGLLAAAVVVTRRRRRPTCAPPTDAVTFVPGPAAGHGDR
jgi:hypothetical protein